MGYVRSVNFTIANGQTTSGQVDLGDGALIGAAVGSPAAITGANMSVTVAPIAGGTFNPLRVVGANVSIAIAANTVEAFSGADMDALSAARFVKFVSDAAEGAERSFTAYLRYQ